MSSPITVAVDSVLETAYITLSDQPVSRTVAISDAVNIDLDRFGVAVGIECLNSSAELPFKELVTEFRVPNDVIQILQALAPDAATFVSWSQMNEGGSQVASPGKLEAFVS